MRSKLIFTLRKVFLSSTPSSHRYGSCNTPLPIPSSCISSLHPHDEYLRTWTFALSQYKEPTQWHHVFFLNILREIIRGFPSKMLHFELTCILASLPSYESFPWISLYKFFELDPSIIVRLWGDPYHSSHSYSLILRPTNSLLSILALPS